MAADEFVERIARAVLDGTAVNWAAVESDAAPEARPLVRELRLLADLTAIHRAAIASDESARAWLSAILESQNSAPIPERWAHLRILEAIGRGASGAVYRAWDPRLDREVALKLLPAATPLRRDHPPGQARPLDETAASSIIEEGRLLVRVRHPNVVTIHGAEQIGDRIGLWMELVRGLTLESLLQSGAPFSGAEAIEIGKQLCSAMAAVHGAGLLHRDIKATNVIRADDGRVVLMDFGAGREADDSAGSDLTGTPLYLAPEVFRGEPAAARSDIYSLGVLLYRLVTGTYPVRGKTIRDVRLAHEQGDRVSLRAARPDLPSALVQVIERATDPNPARRFPTAAAMGAALADVSRRRLPSWRAMVAAAPLLAAVAGLTWVVGRPSPMSTAGPVSPAPLPRIAVLPFASLGAAADDRFALGLASEIQQNIARLDAVYPISFSSSSRFPAEGRDLRAVGTQLGAELLLEGSVLHAGVSLRVTARLVRVADAVELWADTFDRQNADVASIVHDISGAVVDQLRLKLRWRRRHYTRPDLNSLYLAARSLQARQHQTDSLGAAALFQQVVDQDPDFAPAWAGLASALASAYRLRIGDQTEPPDSRMEPAALKAIDLDPFLPEALAALGNVFADRHDWARAEKAFLSAIDQDPSLTSTHMDYAVSVLMPLDRNQEALQLLGDAVDRDRQSPDVRRLLAHFQVNAGLYDEAIATIAEVEALERKTGEAHVWTKLWLGRALVLSGRPEQAVPVFAANPDHWAYLGYTYAVLGERDKAEALLEAHPGQPRGEMLICSGLGDRERAVAALLRLAASNPWRAATWLHREEMKILRGDPRAEAIKARLSQ